MEASGGIGNLIKCRRFHPHGFREFGIVAVMVETLTVRLSLRDAFVVLPYPVLGVHLPKERRGELETGLALTL